MPRKKSPTPASKKVSTEQPTEKPTPNQIMVNVIEDIYSRNIDLPSSNIRLGDVMDFRAIPWNGRAIISAGFFRHNNPSAFRQEGDNEQRYFAEAMEAEAKLLAHFVIAQIHGKDTKGVYTSDTSYLFNHIAKDETPGKLIEKTRDEIKNYHDQAEHCARIRPRLGRYENQLHGRMGRGGEHAMKETVRKIEAEAKQLLENRYPQFSGKAKS